MLPVGGPDSQRGSACPKGPHGGLLLETPVADKGLSYSAASKGHRFAAAVAGSGMLLRNSKHKGHSNFDADP